MSNSHRVLYQLIPSEKDIDYYGCFNRNVSYATATDAHETRLSNGTTVTVVDVSKDVERWLIATVVIHVLVTVFAIITIIITAVDGKGISVILRSFDCYDGFNDCRQMAFLLFDLFKISAVRHVGFLKWNFHVLVRFRVGLSEWGVILSSCQILLQ